MCGLSGVIASRGTLKDAIDRVRVMMAALVHRGPDGSGLWHEPELPVVLGHNRLAIIDPSNAGAQPMVSASQRYVINFNGEIYNFGDLRRALDPGSRMTWRGHSDTEVLLESITTWGVEGALARIEGMFAIAVWDRAERRLWLIRDRIGEKPLHYANFDGMFAFASELGALRDAFGEQLALDASVMPEYLHRGYIGAPRTVYRDVLKLPAGTLVCVDYRSGRPDVSQPVPYWSLRDVLPDSRRGAASPPGDATAQLDRVLKHAIAERMISDVPVGAFLSGGVDSSLVVALMAKHASMPVRAFTVSFEDPCYDESRYAREVVSYLPNVCHVEVRITAADVLALLPTLAVVSGEPFADASQIPLLVLAKAARQQVAVALSGEGADELFGGYDRYFDAERVWRLLSRVPVPMRRVASRLLKAPSVKAWNRLLNSAYQRSDGRRIDGDRIHKLASTLPATDRRQFYSLISGAWRPAHEALLFADKSKGPAAADFSDLSFLEEMMAIDLTSSLPDGILAKVDRATMHASLESRAPFLAEAVVKLAWQLPLECKIKGDRGKRVLRELASNYLPAAICDREKKGFPTPVAKWLRDDMRAWAEHLLEPKRLEMRGFNAGNVRRKWREHLSGHRNWQYALWPVLMWQSFVDSVSSAPATATMPTAYAGDRDGYARPVSQP